MSKLAIVCELEKEQLKKEIPEFRVGDTVRIHTRIIEGDKERVQMFTGIVIAREGSGLSERVSLYRVAFGGSVERKFLLHSPRVAKIERVSEGHVRRAKLYYLIGSSGKKARVRRKISSKSKKVAFVAAVEEGKERKGE